MENGPFAYLSSYLTKTQEKTFNRNLPYAADDGMVTKRRLLMRLSPTTCETLRHPHQITRAPSGQVHNLDSNANADATSHVGGLHCSENPFLRGKPRSC